MGSVKQNDSNGRVVAYTYVGFRDSFSTLMRDLRGLPPSDDRINVRWAHHLVKKCAAKYYCEKTWKVYTFPFLRSLQMKSSEEKEVVEL